MIRAAATLLLVLVQQCATASREDVDANAYNCLERDQTDQAGGATLLESLTPDRCMHHEYQLMKGANPLFSIAELQCLSSIPMYAACSSCYLCHYFVQLGRNNAAFKSATLSLEYYPMAGPTTSCLSAVYFNTNNLVRAAFYASVSHEYNSTMEILYSGVGNNGHVYNFMEDKYRSYLFPEYHGAAVAMKEGWTDNVLPHIDIFADICEQLKGGHTLFTIYSNHLHHLPGDFVGPSLLAMERFLDEFEAATALKGRTSVKDSFEVTNEDAPLDLFMYSESVRKKFVNWPRDKYLILFSENAADSTTYLYSYYIQGLSDALNYLGVAHRVSSVSQQRRDDNAVTVYLKEYVENDSYRYLASATAPEHSYHRYVQWHMEHPFDDQCSSKHWCTEGTEDDIMSCGASRRVYESCRAAVWETSLAELFAELHPGNEATDSNTQPRRLVNALCPHHLLLATRAEQRFASASLSSSSVDLFYQERDSDRPIDILVLGVQSHGRVGLYGDLVKFASQHQLTVRFFMDFNDYSLERERNLINDAKVVVNVMKENSIDAQPSSLSHLFKIRQLLAMGKVVISEESKMSLEVTSIDEDSLSKLVTFATTENIPAVVLRLLGSPATRWDLERKGLQFMMQDHFQQYVSSSEELNGGNSTVMQQPSSLALLADALNKLAVDLWPAGQDFQSGVPGGGEAETTDDDERATTAKALVWAEKYCQQNSMITDLTTGDMAIRNASQPCQGKTRVRILLGYLKRRYKLSGKILWVGCEKGARKYHNLGNLNREFKLYCVYPSPEALKIMLRKFEKQSFELIFINHEVIQYSFEEFQLVMPMLVKYLNAMRGTVLINSIYPRGGNSETWKFAIHLKAFLDVDSALCAFDTGILMLRLRENPYLLLNVSDEIRAIAQKQHEFRPVTASRQFFQLADRFLPILDLVHLHEWLSLPHGTVKLTAIPFDKSCFMSSHDPSHFTEVEKRPHVVCK